MVTTFYPPYHFGGDGTYVQRLVRALVARGHEVDVIHDRDAFHLAHPAEPAASAPEPSGVRVFPMKSPFGRLSPLLTHQTGRPLLKPLVRERLETGRYDVIHFHNASLIGAGAFTLGRATRLYTTHEYWLLCPLSLLWKFGAERCEAPACTRCTLHARRPPQWWRQTGFLHRQLRGIHRFIAPTAYVRDRHRERGFDLPFEVLPSFVPGDGRTVDPALRSSSRGSPAAPATPARAGRPGRPYFLFVGRLVRIKGLHTILDTVTRYGEADLLIAGGGDEEAALRRQAAAMPNVHFLGVQSGAQLSGLYRDAIALIMPSVCDEVFGLVLIEAMAQGTPVIARNLAGMAEVVRDSGGGLLFDDDESLVAAMRRLQHDTRVRAQLATAGQEAVASRYSEAVHLDAYLDLIARVGDERQRAERA